MKRCLRLSLRKTMAEIWAESGIRASLGMRDTAFFPQMPDGDEITAAWSPSGVDRIHTMTWGDGSKVVTYWRPSETGSLSSKRTSTSKASRAR